MSPCLLIVFAPVRTFSILLSFSLSLSVRLSLSSFSFSLSVFFPVSFSVPFLFSSSLIYAYETESEPYIVGVQGRQAKGGHFHAFSCLWVRETGRGLSGDFASNREGRRKRWKREKEEKKREIEWRMRV